MASIDCNRKKNFYWKDTFVLSSCLLHAHTHTHTHMSVSFPLYEKNDCVCQYICTSHNTWVFYYHSIFDEVCNDNIRNTWNRYACTWKVLYLYLPIAIYVAYHM